MDIYPSKIFEEAVNEFATLPGIGRRSALRMVLHLLKQSPEEIEKFGNAFLKLKREIKYCRNCHSSIHECDMLHTWPWRRIDLFGD